MYIRGLAGLPGARGRAGRGRRTGGWSGAARGRGAVTAILFSGVIFYQHRQPSALTNPSTLSARPLYGSPLAIPRTIRPPPHRRTCTDWWPSPPPPPPLSPRPTQDTPRRPTPLASPPLPPCRPISPPYRCSITFAMHFFPSSFFIKLDYNCIASSSCGIAGRKNGTLPGMRVHPRSAGPRGRERKEGGRGCGRANDRFWWSGARGYTRDGRGRANGRQAGRQAGRLAGREGVRARGCVGGKGGGRGGIEQEEKTDEVSRPLDW